MLAISDFVEAIGIERFDAENWRRRVGLRTEFAPTVAGRAQTYSRANVLELALVGAFVRSGATPPTAVAYADMVRRGEGRWLRRWAVFPAGDFNGGFGTDDLTAGAWESCAAKSPHGAVVAIDLQKIIATVDRLFAVPAESAEAMTNGPV